jgi:saccharopine dehydrogenase-like NADP-dependent oxidoreductase
LQERLSNKEGERDMIAMQHRFVVKAKNGEKRYIKSTLIEKGEPGGFSAMAKTVGLPAAIAADLILSNVITRRGVCIPVTPDIYKPILEQLRQLNIMMDEQEVTVADEKAFLNNL